MDLKPKGNANAIENWVSKKERKRCEIWPKPFLRRACMMQFEYVYIYIVIYIYISSIPGWWFNHLDEILQ